MLRAVTLLISQRCNLRCSYCYQSARGGPARMSWGTARAALDLLLASTAEKRAVEFSGGEPTLEPALLRRCIAYLRSAKAPGAAVDCSLTTNGTLLDDDLLAFLAGHDIGLDLSFDGIPAAQDLRRAGSFAALDQLLLRVRRQHPRYFTRRVAVRMMVQGVTLPYLALSVRYLVGREVARIAVGPCILRDSRWDQRSEEILREQVGEVVADSLRHLDATGTIPVGFLAGGDLNLGPRGRSPRCAAVSGACICVDAAGRAWGCPLFARSLRRLPPLAATAARLVALGTVRDRALGTRLARLPRAALNWPLFSASSARRCGSRRCRDCEFVADCLICPAAICEQQARSDPREVPPFHCAFSRVTLEARRRFRDRRARADAAECPAELAEALRDVARALRAGSSRASASQTARS